MDGNLTTRQSITMFRPVKMQVNVTEVDLVLLDVELDLEETLICEDIQMLTERSATQSCTNHKTCDRIQITNSNNSCSFKCDCEADVCQFVLMNRKEQSVKVCDVAMIN